jgi:hypothetical protein
MSERQKVTAADIRAAVGWNTIYNLDGDHYTNAYRAIPFPELVRVDSGPKSPPHPKRTLGHTRTFYVEGVEVPGDPQAIADAINAAREKAKP